MHKLVHKKRISSFFLVFLLSIIPPFTISILSIINGDIPFWYDNARDLLAAWGNLSDPTLIGPPSGIDGIFYGPYWIWFLSIALFFSKDPRIANIIVGVVPYLIIFPLVLYLFSRFVAKTAILVVWIFFVVNIGIDYVTNLWNPHIAPLLVLILIYLLYQTKLFTSDKKELTKIMLLGFVSGILINFHISLGLGVLVGLLFYFLIEYIHKFGRLIKKKIIFFISSLVIFFIGITVSFFPSIIFEIRNEFTQSKVILNTFLGFGSGVGVEGLNHIQVFELFFGRIGTLLGVHNIIAYIIQIFLLTFLFFVFKKNNFKVNSSHKKLLMILASLILGILFLYLLARNPVWDYHFIGVEVLLMLIGIIIISYSGLLRSFFLLWAIVIMISQFSGFISLLSESKSHTNSLALKSQIVEKIHKDANNSNYSFFAYNPSLYIYDYSYLFKCIANKDVSYDPGQEEENTDIVYLVVPKNRDAYIQDFINFRSRPMIYKTIATWEFNNDIIILKRGKK